MKFGRLDLAQKMFDGMLIKNTVTWISLIKGYLEDNDFQSAFCIMATKHGGSDEKKS